MKQKKGKKQRLSRNLSSSDGTILFCMVLLVGFVPLIIYNKIQRLVVPVIDPMLNFETGGSVDYFTYYKSLALILLTVSVLLLFLARIFLDKRDLKNTVLNIPLLTFVLALCLSVVFSSYKTFALWGGHTRNLGVITYLSCAVILFCLINSKVDSQWERKIIFALCPLVVINTVMLLLLYYGINLWDNSFFVALVAGNTGQYLTESSRISGTLNHRNYLSGLGAILFALFVAKTVMSVNKSRFDYERGLYILMAVFSAVIVFTSKALSGVVTIFFIIPLMIGLIFESREKNRLLNFAGITGLTILAWIILSLHDASFIREFIDDAGLLIGSAGFGFVFFGVYLLIKNWKKINKRRVAQVGGALLVLCLTVSFLFGPKALEKATAEFNRTNTDLIMQRLEKDPFDFPEAKFGWGTGRVYIWQSTLKLVAEKPLFGYGFDTLSFEFNQGDPAKIAGLADADTIVDKPHNMYINMLYGAGAVTFLAFIAIVVLVIWSALKALSTDSEYRILIWPLFLGVLAYLYQGLFNDPVHGVEPIFWVLMGLTYAFADKALSGEAKNLKSRQ